jgi:NADH:ubiquinone oxidoreductase subunit C
MSFNPQLFTNFRNYFKNLFPQSLSYIINGDLYIKIPSTSLSNVMLFLKMHSITQYKILADICAVDFPWKKKRFQIFYNLLTIRFNSRINIFLEIDEQTSVKSISSFFKVAGWFEREVWDMFGIHFTGHPDLRRILTDYGFKGHPLRKDFPMTGYTEVRYFHNEKRILVEEVSLTQDYRTFYFNNSWNINI